MIIHMTSYHFWNERFNSNAANDQFPLELWKILWNFIDSNGLTSAKKTAYYTNIKISWYERGSLYSAGTTYRSPTFATSSTLSHTLFDIYKKRGISRLDMALTPAGFPERTLNFTDFTSRYVPYTWSQYGADIEQRDVFKKPPSQELVMLNVASSKVGNHQTLYLSSTYLIPS